MFYLNGETDPLMHPHLKFLTLLYLAECKDLCPTGKYQALHEIKGGQFFFRGSHELPLARLAGKFGKDADAFYKKGVSLGGIKAPYGDMSILLYPFPKIPLVYIFWKEDDEFPARITLLFDETAEKHLLLEGLWGTAFFTTNIFMLDIPPIKGKGK
ncbi:DUF3786 domain-containing protein [Candidatus Desantisbacteria bacterium]|nr:DUF3786 domain-containing protein [Candidatus Desantisbacteria bacterium]